MKLIAYRLSIILLIACFYLLLLPITMVSQAQENYEQAYEQTSAEFISIKNSSHEASQKLEELSNLLIQAEGNLNLSNTSKYISAENKKALIEKINQSKQQVNSYKKVLNDFNSNAGYVTDALEAYDTVKEFKTQYNSYASNQGELAANLFALSTAMEKTGDSIPVLGEAIKEYGSITTKLLSATANLSNKIDEIRNQGAISGPGYYKTGRNLEKYNILKDKRPDLAERVIYRPAVPSFVYTSDDKSDPKLIWDNQSKVFYFIPATIPIEDIFKMNLIALHNRRTPFELNILSEKWETVFMPLKETANKLPSFINNFKSGLAMESFATIDQKYNGIFLGGMKNNIAFEANYIFNRRYRDRLHSAINDLYNLLKSKNLLSAAEKIKVFANQNNIKIIEGAEPQKTQIIQKPVTPTEPKQMPLPMVPDQNQQVSKPNSNYSFYTGSIEALIPAGLPQNTEIRIVPNTYGEIAFINFFTSPSIGPVSTVDFSMKITKHTTSLNSKPLEEVKRLNNFNAFSSAKNAFSQITKFQSNYKNLQIYENNVEPWEVEKNVWLECLDKFSQNTYHIVYYSQNPYPNKTIRYLNAHAGNIEIESSISYFENRNSEIDLKKLANEILATLQQKR